MSKCPYTWFKSIMGKTTNKDSGELATQLRVTVFHGEEERVNVSLPAKSARWLVSLIPEGVLETIRSEGIPLDEIQKNHYQYSFMYHSFTSRINGNECRCLG